MRQETKQMLETCHEFGQACLDTANEMMNARPEAADALTNEQMTHLSTNINTCRPIMQDCLRILGSSGKR